MRRVHRETVDVLARFGRDGHLEPCVVVLKDCRAFRMAWYAIAVQIKKSGEQVRFMAVKVGLVGTGTVGGGCLDILRNPRTLACLAKNTL